MTEYMSEPRICTACRLVISEPVSDGLGRCLSCVASGMFRCTRCEKLRSIENDGNPNPNGVCRICEMKQGSHVTLGFTHNDLYALRYYAIRENNIFTDLILDLIKLGRVALDYIGPEGIVDFCPGCRRTLVSPVTRCMKCSSWEDI